MKKFRAYFSNTKIQVKKEDGSEPLPKDLGFVTFFHFEDSKVSMLSKAFLLASGPQQDADRVEFVEV